MEQAGPERYGFVPADGATHAWERLKGETLKAFEAFVLYRDLGAERSTIRVSVELKKSKSLIDRWCGGWRWVERVRLYEAYLDQQRQRALVKQVEEMLERHTQYARWLQTKAAAAIIEVKPAALTVEQARRYLETGIKVERDALGVVNGRPPSSANDGGQEQTPGGFLESYLAGLEEEELDLLIANLRLGLENNP